MLVDCYKPSQMIAPIAAAVLDVVCLPEDVNTALGTRNVVTDPASMFLSNPISKENKNQLTFLWEGQEFTFTASL